MSVATAKRAAAGLLALALVAVVASAGQAEETRAVKNDLPQPVGTTAAAAADGTPSGKGAMTLATFLDRLMIAESGGRANARNPRSTAVGPFQFIESTFLDIAARHFTAETAKLAPAAVLLLRTNRDIARRAAEIYTKENASLLAAAGIEPTFPRLRLAFLLGPSAAIRVIQAKSDTPMAQLVGPAVIRANPFMARLTAAGLIARAARDIETDPATRAGISGGTIAKPRPPAIPVKCNLALASCQRWLALAKKRLARGQPVTPRRSASR